MFDQATILMLWNGVLETLYMTLVSTLIAYVIGLPLGVILVVTDKNGIKPLPAINGVLGFIINALRSVPFLILLVTILPFTRFIAGTTIGSTATIVPLVVASAPYIARMVESSLKEVDGGVVEAAKSMGSSPFQIVTKVMIPEAKPSLSIGAAITITTILGYSALAGFTGGGGIGVIASNYGYYRGETGLMYVCVIILVILVQIFQEIGLRLSKATDKRVR